MWIEHRSPSDRQIIEEIVLKNEGSSCVQDFPIPLSEFLQGLRIIDEDGCVLPFLSRDEVYSIIGKYQPKLKERIELQLRHAYLVWIRLPEKHLIRPGELRSIRLCFWGSGIGNPIKVKFSIFDIRQYSEYLANSIAIETSYFITAPEGCIVEVVKKHTYSLNVDTKEELKIDYQSDPARPKLQEDTAEAGTIPIIISNEPHYISVFLRQPEYQSAYLFQLVYRVKLPKIERRLLEIAVPVSIFLTIALILSPFVPMAPSKSLICMTYSITHISILKESIQTVGLIAAASIGALIALKNDPMIARTRAILLGELILILILILIANKFEATQCN
jgi:hypothetical protein